MKKSKLALGLVLGATLALSGCWESSDVTVHKAGEYRGGKDPLLGQQAASRAEALNKRFQLVQMDR